MLHLPDSLCHVGRAERPTRTTGPTAPSPTYGSDLRSHGLGGHHSQSPQHPAFALGFTWPGNGSRTVFGCAVPDHVCQFDIREDDLRGHAACTAEQPTPPQCHKAPANGAANSSSTNQNAWPHSLSPTFGRIIIGPTIAATNGKDVAGYTAEPGLRIHKLDTPHVMYNGNVP